MWDVEGIIYLKKILFCSCGAIINHDGIYDLNCRHGSEVRVKAADSNRLIFEFEDVGILSNNGGIGM